MAMTVGGLVSSPGLGLELREPGAEGALEARVRWVHQSELADSSLFTEPGEVLITAASHLPTAGSVNDARLARLCDEFVGGLVGTGVVALGVGVGVKHAEIPPQLLDAARRRGLPVFEIPWEVAFSAVIKVVSKSRSDAEHTYLRRASTAQRRLIQAAGRPNLAQSLVTSTAQIIGGWAALADAHGVVIVHTHTDHLDSFRKALVAHLESGRVMSYLDEPGLHTVCQTIGRPPDVRGVLIAGSSGELDALSVSTCLLASNLLADHLGMRQRVESALAGVRAALLEEALDGNARPAQRARDAWPETPTDPLQLVCAVGDPELLATVPLDDLPAAWGLVDDRLWIVAARGSAARVGRRLEGLAGVEHASAPATWADLPRACGEVVRALGGAATSLLSLVPPDKAREFARSRLGGLLDPSSQALLATVHSWLAHDHNIDLTAAALGVHRHTVRRRLERAQEVIGADLSDAGIAHDLWFACEVAASDPQLATTPGATMPT